MSELVRVQNVTKMYGNSVGLAEVTLALEPGRIVGLLGPNGSGKTTLLKVLAGLIKDHKGSVEICGKPIGVESKAAVSLLPDKTCLAEWMRPRDARALFADFFADFDNGRATELMKRFGIEEDKRVKQMSKGTQDKLQLILVMSRRAKLYLLDEPLGGIDPAARGAMLDIILANYDTEATVLLSTHLIHDVERIFDSVIMLKQGRVAIFDEVDKLRESTGKTLEEQFLEVFAC